MAQMHRRAGQSRLVPFKSREFTDSRGVKRSVPEAVMRHHGGDITLLAPKIGMQKTRRRLLTADGGFQTL